MNLKGTFQVGNLTIHQLSDGANYGVRQSWWTSLEGPVDPSVWVPVLGVEDAERLFPVNFGCFAVIGDGQVTLVDTGNGVVAKGREGMEGGGEMLDRLFEVGLKTTDVTRIVQTHLHSDHCGWLVKDDGGELTFPNATVYLHENELKYWTGPASDDNRMNPFVRTRINPWVAAGKVVTFDKELAISDALTAIPTPGHTPGHSSLLVASEGKHALLLGDVAHHPVHVEHPEWVPIIDQDRPASIASRKKMWALAVEKDALITAPHMPIVTLGRVRPRGDGYSYTAIRTPDGWNRERPTDYTGYPK